MLNKKPTKKQNKWNDPFYKNAHADQIKIKLKSGGMKVKERLNLIRKGAFK